ncbi:MAG: arsenic resistance protein, partial [Legionellales bacterium]
MGKGNQLHIFEKHLYLGVTASIVTGIFLGTLYPSTLQTIGSLEFAQVNLLVGILIWIMIIPMLIRIDLKEIFHVHTYWRGIIITLGINWLIKPFSMVFLGWFFLKHLFSAGLPLHEIDSYIAGLVLLAAAPGTAMVFVWSYLSHGEPHFTLSQVALNDLIVIFMFVPIVSFLLNLTGLHIPRATLFLSILLYVLIPFLIAQGIRHWILSGNLNNIEVILKKIHPFSIAALLAMLVLLFGFQGHQIIESPIIVVLIAIPILIQVYSI